MDPTFFGPKHFIEIIPEVQLLQGSVIVFGAWSSWTDDYQLYSANPDSYNYCQYEPMMFAFCILIIKWVSSEDNLPYKALTVSLLGAGPSHLLACVLLWDSLCLLLLQCHRLNVVNKPH